MLLFKVSLKNFLRGYHTPEKLRKRVLMSVNPKKVQVELNSPKDKDSETLLLQSKLLLEITKSESIDQGDVKEAVKKLSDAAAVGLGIERVSVWLYNEDQSAIVCIDLFETSTQRHASGLTLQSKDFPAYFKYLREERTLAANNAVTDPSTFEFAEVYLKPLNIFSLLDAPIRKNGKMIGVICNEKVGSVRNWSLLDEAYAATVADFISRTFIAQERLLAQESLRKMNENLEKLVLERTQELEVQRAFAIQSAKMASLGEMSAGIAHEINPPLATIQLIAGQLTSMVEDNEVDAEALAKHALNIEITTNRIGKIIQSLRSFARDGATDVSQNIKVRSLLTDTMAFCEEKFRLASIEINFDEVPENLSVECRVVQIQQVILNLFNNSFDAISKQAEPKWIRVKASGDEKNIHIFVTDGGPGIPKQIQDKIMQPFVTTKEIGKGTGLGLSVSLGIIQSHQGTLTLEKNAPHTCFLIKLPIKQ